MPTVKRIVENPLKPKEGLFKDAWDLIFGSDPVEEMQSSLGPTPLVSIYKNAAARRLATQQFLKDAMDKLGEEWMPSAAKFAEKYPRVAAHIGLYKDAIKPEYGTMFGPESGTRATTIPPQGKVKKKIPVVINSESASGSLDKMSTMFHEGTHVAQSLGNSESNALYNLFHKLVGYTQNPMEVSARNAGFRSVNPELKRVRTARPFMQRELEAAEKYPMAPDGSGPIVDVVKEIADIMAKRGMLRDPNIVP